MEQWRKIQDKNSSIQTLLSFKEVMH